MDPFLSISKLSLVKASIINPVPYLTHKTELNAKIINGSFTNENKLVDLDLVSDLNILELNLDSLTPKQYHILETVTNPFSKIGNSIFINDGAVKLANIDAVFNITDSIKGDLGLLPSHLSRRYVYVTLGDPVGSLAQYIQYRKKFTMGYGMSLSSDNKLDLTKVETRGPNVYFQEWGDFEYGGDGTGNLYTNIVPLIKKMREFYVHGLDLVVATGYVKSDIDSNKQKTNIESDEIRNYRLLVNEIYGGIRLVKEGGIFVIKIFTIYTDAMINLIYLVTSCFDKIYIIKPVTSSNVLDERYLVCIGFKGDEKVKNQLKLLKRLIKIINNENNKEKENNLPYLDLDIPNDFEIYIKNINNYVLGLKINVLDNMVKVRKNGMYSNKMEYSISKLLLGLDIPSGTN